MPRLRHNSKRALDTLDALTTTPPPELSPSQHIARIHSPQGKNLFLCTLLSSSSSSSSTTTQTLYELAHIFRGKAWLRRGGYVVVDTASLGGREGNRLAGEIVNVVREEREWRKMKYWPEQFGIRREEGGEEEEESVVGKMPPGSDDED